MIASGGVSGGFSSMIAGGNFMDGFRQGIITSGLNHVAHLVNEAIEDPDDIIFKNKKGKELGRIVIKEKNKVVTINTDLEVKVPYVWDPNRDWDALSINIDGSATVGGGMHFGASIVYFNHGLDAGSAYIYRYWGGNVGFEGGGGISFTMSYYVDTNKTWFNANGFSGKSSGYSGGYGPYSASYSWANRNNNPELYPNMNSQVTWKSYNSGFSKGSAGGKVYWSNSVIWKKLF